VSDPSEPDAPPAAGTDDPLEPDQAEPANESGRTRRRGLSVPLHIRQFRLLFGGQVVSNLGDWLDFLALVVLIAYVWHMGAAALAALAVVVAVPWIVVAPFVGPLADRWPKKTVMIGADLARAAAVVGLIFAPNLAVLLVLVGIKTVFSTLFAPAEEATIRFTVPDEELHAANALSHFVGQATKVVGPALGGLLVGLTNPRVAFGVDAATFLASALILSRMTRVEAGVDDRTDDGDPDEDEEELGYWQEMREGLTHILSRRALMLGIFGMAAATFLLVAFDTLSPLAFLQLGATKAEFGLAIGAVGLGGVVGAVLVGRYGGDANPFVLMGASELVVGGLVALVGWGLLSHADLPPLTWVPVLLVVGLAAAGVLIAAPTIIQLETPPQMMGRVSASAGAVPTVFQVFAPIVGAAVASWRSVGFVFAAAGGGLAALGVVMVILRMPVGVGVDDAEVEAAIEASIDQAEVGDASPTLTVADVAVVDELTDGSS
jgi:MFS family permease